jgi:hypothetical protein
MVAISPNALRRLQYCASELGFTLQVVDPVANTFTLVFDKDRKTIHSTGVAASAVSVKAAMTPVDPSISSAT